MRHANGLLIRPLDCRRCIAMPPGSMWAVPSTTSPCPRIARQRPCAGWLAFTADLHAVADWRHACHIDTVVMASTGVYGIPLVHILAARGCAVHVVYARHANNLPGRHTDSADGQWLQILHTCGRLHSACRPTDDIWV
jgi:transposase